MLRRNLDGSEARSYLSNAPAATSVWTLGSVGAQRWPIESEFQTEKGETGLAEYEVRSWRGWHRHITLALLAGAFLLQVQQEWGEKMPQVTRQQISRVLRELLPHRTWSRVELLQWLRAMQARNERVKRSHIKRCLANLREVSL